MWQATNKGNISGIIGPVDINFLMLPKTNINLKLSSKKKFKFHGTKKVRDKDSDFLFHKEKQRL